MKRITLITAIVLFSYLIFDISMTNINKNREMNDQTSVYNEYKSKYIVKEYNGKLAVFENDSQKPFRVTELKLKILPLYDQKLLKNGIEVYSVSELNKVLEDYLS